VFGGIASADPLAPGFVTLDRFDGGTRAGVEVSGFVPRGIDGTVWRADVHGQFVEPGGLGGYVALPFAMRAGGAATVAGVGDLEAGVLYVPRFTTPDASAVLHVGMTAPTGSTGEGAQATALAGAATRLSDAYEMIPRGTSLRIGASPILREGMAVLRLDLDFDWKFDADGPKRAEPLFRLGVGVGADEGIGMVTAELVIVRELGLTHETSEQLALGARATAWTTQPYGALLLPLGGAAEVALTVGVETALR
jgi:hypothetical protein